MYHSKTNLIEPVKNKFYSISYDDKNTESIIDIKNFEFKLISNEKETKLKFSAKMLDFNLPHHLHFGAITHEISK